MRFSTVALSLASLAYGLDISNSQDSESSIWDAPGNAPSDIDARDNSLWNRPAKRQSGWNPPSNLVTPLRQVWQHQLDTYSNGLYGFRNYGWDQLRATQGYVGPKSSSSESTY